MLTFNPPPHLDAVAMIRRAQTQLRAWHAKYGEFQPDWLPPADDVRWLEDADAFLAAHTMHVPLIAGSTLRNQTTTWRTGPNGRLVRVCEKSDAECSRGCNVGPCAKATAGVGATDAEASRHQPPSVGAAEQDAPDA